MQFELRTQVIEPQRKTFQHLIDRYGDRPATRYQEGSIDIQAKVNFHFRPLWDPDKELYDPAFSDFRLTDPYSFTDPRQFYYAPYVTARAELHEAFGSTLAYVEKRGLFEKLPAEWRDLFTELVLPLRHYEAGCQMLLADMARFGYGTTITQCAAYSAFDRIGNAQILSRTGIAVEGGTAALLGAAKTSWMEDAALQGIRRLIEELLVQRDWGRAFVAMDVTDQLLFAVLYDHLDGAALVGAAGSYSLVAQHLSGWFADQRRWVDALYKAWVADPELGAENARLLGEVGEDALARAEAALAPLAARADELVGADSVGALQTAISQVRAGLAAAGANVKEA